ncbi:Ribosomal protein S13 [Spironucleus salmonicida]|uniref:Ribosomal protein S13 n=1 Tax=Spironucleus salmonicida TaxID=348837 RepID=V6LQJ8_9EUKA|nr:Ribosomal protein S13 [Spironucleus salmonicida]|eukprot:EST46523.1 Ribosomal protein S13 [Spironucleus salmonicida]
MARQYSKGKGIARSLIPSVRRAPAFQKATPEFVAQTICSLAKKGHMPSKIGMVLRDQFAIGRTEHITHAAITRILRANGLAPELPEDLYCLIRKAVAIRKHLERNPRDVSTKYHLILIESRIHRISRYYRSTRSLPPTFRYKPANAAALLATFA